MAGGDKIRAAGLTALRRAFKNTSGKAFDKYLAKVHRKIAQDVVSAAKPGIAAVSSTTAAAVEAVTSAAASKIRISREEAPMAGGVIFGAIRTKRRIGPSGRVFRGYAQFRQFKGEPYHLWPELDAMRDTIADNYIKAINDFYDSEGVPR